MATLVPNRFTSWNLLESESLQGKILNDLQIKTIQNLIADTATQKVSIKYDPQKPLDFVQQEAYMSGQIEILEYLLDQHQAALEAQSQLSQSQE